MTVTHVPASDVSCRFRQKLGVLLLFYVAYSAVCLVAQTSTGNTPTLNKGNITELLTLGTPDTLLIPRVQAAGINFVATPADLDSFRRLGASPAFLAAIREASGRFAAQKAAEDARIVREREVQSWDAVLRKPSLSALQSYLKDFPNGANAGAARRRLAVLNAAIARIDADDKARGSKSVGHIVAIREANEDAVIGLLPTGEYFRATTTPTEWVRLSPSAAATLPQEIRDDLNSIPNTPLVWLVNPDSIRDPAYNKHYQDLFNNARLALNGGTAGRILIMLSPSIPSIAYETNGASDVAKFAYANLNYSALSDTPNSVATTTGTPVAAPRAATDALPAESPGFEYRTQVNKGGGSASQTAPAAGAAFTAPTPSTYYLRGNKMRVDTGEVTNIIDCDARAITALDNHNRTYSVLNFSELKVGAKGESAKPTIDLKETRQTKKVSDLSVTQLIATIEMDPSPSASTRFEVEMWRSIGGPDPGSVAAPVSAFFEGCRSDAPWAVNEFPWSVVGSAGALQGALAGAFGRFSVLNGVMLEETLRIISAPTDKSVGTNQKRNRKRTVPVPPAPPVTYTISVSGFSRQSRIDAAFAVPAFYHKADLAITPAKIEGGVSNTTSIKPATVCVFQSATGGSKVSTPVSMDSVYLGLLHRGHYFCFSPKPGVHNFVVGSGGTTEKEALWIDVRPGQVYSLESLTGFRGGVRHVQFQREITRLKRADAKDLVGSELVKWVKAPLSAQ